MRRLRTAGSIALVAAAAWSGVWLIQRAVRADRAATDGARLLDAVMLRVRDSYVDEVDDERLWELATAGMIDELGDPNSAYLTPERLEALERTASNSYVGVGLSVDVREGWVTVSQPRAGSPAERAGILTGDRLVEVDGRSMRGWTVEEARRAFRGPPGSTLVLTIERGSGADARHTYTLERAAIVNRSVARATVLDGGVGYLAVTTFSDSTEVELVHVVDSLRAGGARSIILDLRNNPGGLLAQGVQVADLFLAPGKRIVSTKGRVEQANSVYVDSTAERWRDMPVAVLVNHLTASAAEIVAGALQDHDRALVVGRATYGKGSAQALYRLENGAAISLTNARWVTPLGRSIEYPLPGEQPLADADTARPRFRTPMGRTVLGGGGIVPDVVEEDSSSAAGERRFNIELGDQVRAWRQLARDVAESYVRRGAVRDSLFTVPREWRDDLYREMERRGIAVSVLTYGEASAFVDGWLGAEAARLAFGAPYQQRRAARNDRTVQRAAEVLRRARTAKDALSAE
jgi:carboxyl-terminal processing protease